MSRRCNSSRPNSPARKRSGSQGALRPPSPLRTVRDGFPSYGSSLGHLNEGVQMALDLLPFPAFGGSVNPLLQPPYRLLSRGPVATGPQGWVRRIGPFSEKSHRLTSPMLRALLRFLTAKTSRTSAPFRVGYPCLATALSAPLQGGLRFLRPLLPPAPSPSLRSGYRRGGRHGASPVDDREDAGG
jgi:hypothetical protein